MDIAATNISDVPTETIEIILDFLHDDPSALYSSSLVCRNWLSSPRYHIFNRVLLNEVEQLAGRVLQENVRPFLALIKSEHCTFLSYIQCIILNVATQTLVEDVIYALPPLKMFSQIVFMHHRTRRDTDYASGQTPIIAWNGTSLHNVRDFTFNALTEFGDDAWALIASFDNLCSLTINILERIPFFPPSQPHISQSRFCNLRTLRLLLKAHEELLSWLQASDGEHYALETFDLWLYNSSHRGWGPVNMLNSFLKNISDTLKHLSIGIAAYDSLVDHSVHQAQHIDLGPLDKLQSLFLCTRDIDAVSDALASLRPSQELGTLTVNALPCKCSRMIRDMKCNCVLPQQSQIARLGSSLEQLQLNRTRTRVTLNVPKRWAQEDVLGELMTLVQKDALKLLYCGNMYNGPVNSFEALSHLGLMVWRDIVPGSWMKPDGSYELLPRNTSYVGTDTVP